MRLAIAHPSLVAWLLLISVSLARGQSLKETRYFRIPYPGPSEPQVSDVVLALPFVRIGEPWRSFSGRKTRTSEEKALWELLSAVYRGDVATAAAWVKAPERAVSADGLAGYIKAFKASLERAGEVEVQGYFPLPGRVRFVLRPMVAKESYRLLTMRPGPEGHLRFDETEAPNRVDSALNAIFRVLNNVNLEVSGIPTEQYVSVETEKPSPDGAIRIAARALLVDAYLEQLPAEPDAALTFYRDCFAVPEEKLIETYFRCFTPEVRGRLQDALAKMTLDQQHDLLLRIKSRRHVDYVIYANSSEIVYYTTTSMEGRDWIDHVSPNRFVLLDSSRSFPLDELLSSTEVRSSIFTALKHLSPSSGSR